MDTKIAICKNDKIFRHSESWTDAWISFCDDHKLKYEIVDCYRYDIVDKLRNFDVLVWHPQNYVLADMMEARSVLYTAKQMGLRIFPDYNTAWHFDDKIAETYLLQSVHASIPKNWFFYLLDDCVIWLKNEAQYPLVAKLKCGSGSNNVKLLHSKSNAIRYANRLFKGGLNSAPSLIYKIMSKLKSSHNWHTALSRIIRIPEFLQTLSHANMFAKERGYTYFQEFIPNDGYDLKVVVIGDKVSGFARNTRKGEFRASGGGDIVYDKSLVTKQVRDSAFEISDALGFQCMGFDFVVNNKTNLGYIVECSFGFSSDALIQVGGHWNRNGEWHGDPLNAPEEVLKNLLLI